MFLFFQAEDGIRYLVRSRGLGDVYKRQSKSESMRWSAGGAKSASSIPMSSVPPAALAKHTQLSLIHI